VTFRRCSCALCCLPKTQAFTGIAASTCANYPPRCSPTGLAAGAARGASTITQQLAKNLFLSRDKQLGRKLQELAITFLLESALGKDRILEIYLNIIEWGPDLRGLRPAARRYFGREARELTPAEMAFLVADHPRADQVPEFIRARYAGAWACVR